MSEHSITLQAGNSLRLLTAGKYCDRDIVVTAEDAGGSQLDAMLDGSIAAIRSNITKLGDYACRARSKLTSVELPELASIGVYAFQDCVYLESFYGPKVTGINSYAFYGCSRLLNVRLPKAPSISVGCFHNCKKLETLDLGAVKSISGSAFYSCTALQTVILRYDGVATLNSTSFNNTNFAGYVYVPAAQVDSYKAASYWSNYADQIRAIEDYPDICGT